MKVFIFLFIESEFKRNISFSEIVKSFASSKSRKKSFYKRFKLKYFSKTFLCKKKGNFLYV